MKKIISYIVICFCIKGIHAQQTELNIYRIYSAHTSFPDTARANGHIYNNVLYDAANHYMDSSVLIIAPKKLNAHGKIDLVFWFHGWQNNIDSAATRFELIRQFEAAHVNAVLVLAETTKNAPDSYGGKLEYNNTFKELVTDILKALRKEKAVSKKTEPGNILLAGHSGAYRVMAHILANGNVPVQEVILFDALYGQTDKYMNWITSDNRRRLINIYTDGGGTDRESKEMMKQLLTLNFRAVSIEEDQLTAPLLQEQKIVFIHSPHQHNEIINNPDNFKLFLETTPFCKKLKE